MKSALPISKISWSLLLLLSLFTALDALAIDIYLPAFPLLADSFTTSPGHITHALGVSDWTCNRSRIVWSIA